MPDLPAGRELDLRVAEAMGREVITAKSWHRMRTRPDMGTLIDDGESLYELTAAYRADKKWSPSKSIADAWWVVEKMEERGFVFSIGRDTNASGPGEWVASFRRWGSATCGYVSTGETAPLAISLAALKALEADHA